MSEIRVVIGFLRLKDFKLGITNIVQNSYGVDTLQAVPLIKRKVDIDLTDKNLNQAYLDECMASLTQVVIRWLEHEGHADKDIILFYEMHTQGWNSCVFCFAYERPM